MEFERKPNMLGVIEYLYANKAKLIACGYYDYLSKMAQNGLDNEKWLNGNSFKMHENYYKFIDDVFERQAKKDAEVARRFALRDEAHKAINACSWLSIAEKASYHRSVMAIMYDPSYAESMIASINRARRFREELPLTTYLEY